MAFIPENPLEEAMLRAASNPLAAPDFYKLLMTSPLYVIGDTGGAHIGETAFDLNSGAELKVAAVRHNGRVYHPIFSAASRLQTFIREPTGYLQVQGQVLFNLAKGANFVLNAKSEYGKELLAPEIAYWLDPAAHARDAISGSPPGIMLGMPAVYPRKLADALSMLFVNRSAVVSARLMQIAFSDRNEPPHPLIGIELRDSSRKIFAEVSELAAAIVPDTIIDLVVVDRTRPEDALSAELLKIEPFYLRTTTLN